MEMYAFVYHATFDRTALRLMSDEDQVALENTLRTDPRAGDVIPGTNGARKVRFGIERRGKSGGGRAIYVFVDVADTFHMILCYPKNVQGNLTEAQKKALRTIIRAIKEDAR
jgi:hypothetical protein